MRYVKIKIHGKVQGVGMRYFIRKLALSYKVFGYAKNLPDKTVESLLIGDPLVIDNLIEEIKKGPSLAKVTKIDILEDRQIDTQEFEKIKRMLGYN